MKLFCITSSHYSFASQIQTILFFITILHSFASQLQTTLPLLHHNFTLNFCITTSHYCTPFTSQFHAILLYHTNVNFPIFLHNLFQFPSCSIRKKNWVHTRSLNWIQCTHWHSLSVSADKLLVSNELPLPSQSLISFFGGNFPFCVRFESSRDILPFSPHSIPLARHTWNPPVIFLSIVLLIPLPVFNFIPWNGFYLSASCLQFLE